MNPNNLPPDKERLESLLKLMKESQRDTEEIARNHADENMRKLARDAADKYPPAIMAIRRILILILFRDRQKNVRI